MLARDSSPSAIVNQVMRPPFSMPPLPSSSSDRVSFLAAFLGYQCMGTPGNPCDLTPSCVPHRTSFQELSALGAFTKVTSELRLGTRRLLGSRQSSPLGNAQKQLLSAMLAFRSSSKTRVSTAAPKTASEMPRPATPGRPRVFVHSWS